MKNCNKCNETKALDEFYKDKTTKDGLKYRCKKCSKTDNNQRYLDNPEYYKQRHSCNPEYQKQYHLDKKDNHHSVYLLPKHNYVGITNSIYHRMGWHRSNGRDTTDYRILETFQDRKLGLELEAHLHNLGYEGKYGY